MPRPTFSRVGKPLLIADIAVAEAELGVVFPEQYRSFLLQTNGGHPEPDCFDDYPINMFCGIGLTGPSNLVYYASLAWRVDTAADVMAIAYGSFGFSICIGIRGDKLGKMYLHDQESQTLRMLAEDLDTFLSGFHEPDLSNLDDDEDDLDDDPEIETE